MTLPEWFFFASYSSPFNTVPVQERGGKLDRAEQSQGHASGCYQQIYSGDLSSPLGLLRQTILEVFYGLKKVIAGSKERGTTPEPAVLILISQGFSILFFSPLFSPTSKGPSSCLHHTV